MSFVDGYTEDEVEYIWSGESDAVKKYKDIAMAQFDLTDIEHGRRRTGDNHGTFRSHLLTLTGPPSLKSVAGPKTLRSH